MNINKLISDTMAATFVLSATLAFSAEDGYVSDRKYNVTKVAKNLSAAAWEAAAAGILISKLDKAESGPIKVLGATVSSNLAGATALVLGADAVIGAVWTVWAANHLENSARIDTPTSPLLYYPVVMPLKSGIDLFRGSDTKLLQKEGDVLVDRKAAAVEAEHK